MENSKSRIHTIKYKKENKVIKNENTFAQVELVKCSKNSLLFFSVNFCFLLKYLMFGEYTLAKVSKKLHPTEAKQNLWNFSENELN
jgi:hypothetical protein